MGIKQPKITIASCLLLDISSWNPPLSDIKR